MFFDNWFTMLDIMLYLRKEGPLAVRSIRSNCLQGCPLVSNNDLEKSGGGVSDYCIHIESEILP